MSRKKFTITDIDFNELSSLIASAKERERKEKERREKEERERKESKEFWDNLEKRIEEISSNSNSNSNIEGGKLQKQKQKQKQLKLPKSKAKKATKATNKKVK